MKFAFIADIHLSRYGQDKIEEQTHLPERLYSIKQALHEVAEYCIKHEIPKIIIGGDILHGKSIIYAIAQEIMLTYFHTYEEKLEFIVIDGNHDISSKGSEAISALRSLQTVNNVLWVPFNEINKIDPNILLIPYSTNLPSLIKSNKAKILISHFGLSEGVLNSGMSIVSNVSMKDLREKYELVLLGHYHKPQKIISDGVTVYYAGSLIQLDWSEKNEEKRFLVVDSDTLHVDSIPITQYKKHIQIEITADNKDTAIQAARDAKAAGDHVKVILKETIDLTELKGEFNIIDKTDRDITDRGITSNMSTKDKLKKYLEIKEIPEAQHEMYLSVAMEIIRNEEEITV